MTAAVDMPNESFVATRDLRVAVGDDLQVVDVKFGDPWPANARGRLDVYLRTGMVVRFDENGEPDKRSARFVRRLGLKPPAKYPQRMFAIRATADAVMLSVGSREIQVLAGRHDRELRDFVVVGGLAFHLLRGAPDDAAAAEVRSAARRGARSGPGQPKSVDGSKSSDGGRRRRRKPAKG